MGDSSQPDSAQAVKSNELIEEFIQNYEKTVETWREITKLARDLCSKNRRPGIQARFEFRVKTPESLKNKLIKRNEEMAQKRNGPGYQSTKEIWEDIYDRAGVRILLYTSAQPQLDAVRDTIRSTFDPAMEPKRFPEAESKEIANGNPPIRRFPKYTATHYRVYLKDEHVKQLEDNNVKLKGIWQGKFMIEIQVVSVFQHVCAEVSHDILYKTMSGTPSVHEERVFDALSGVSLLGDLLLEQLHYHYEARVNSTNQPFTNKYELGSFLSDWTSQNPSATQLVLGPMEILRRFLVAQGKATPRDLEAILSKLSFGDEARSETADGRVSIYIMEQMFKDHPVTVNADGNAELQSKVIASAMIWLDELFSPSTKWGTKLFNKDYPRNPKQKEGLKWLMNETEGEHFLVHNVEPLAREKENLEDLWQWFQGHEEPIVEFVVKVSKVEQLRRDLKKESETLEKIAALLDQVDGSNDSESD